LHSVMFSSPSKTWLIGAGAVLLLPAASALLWTAMRSKKRSDATSAPWRPTWTSDQEKPVRLEKFIFVRVEQVGLVLGKQTRTLRRIEHETRTILNLVSYAPNEIHDNVDALRAYEDAVNSWNNNEVVVPNENDRLHFIRVHAQTPDQIQLVELAIDAILADGRRRKNVDELRIPAESVKHIIGRGGEHIKRLSRNYRVRLLITQTGEDYETVTLEGTPEGIEAAKTRILQKIDWTSRPEEEEIEQSVDEQMREILDLKAQLEDETEWW
ncbi:hypothetical protein PENTCL1PPCAC_12772, partial [Pristionchus entomophagus]